MKPIAFAPEAADELHEAYEFYESRAVGLGDDLHREADVQLRRIAKNPSLYARAPRVRPALGVRRAPLPGFPYSIVYLELEHEVLVLAFANHRKRPRYWRGRLR